MTGEITDHPHSPTVRALRQHGIVRVVDPSRLARDHFVNSLLPFEFDRPAYLWLARP